MGYSIKENHREYNKVYSKKWRAANPEKCAGHSLKYNYGLSIEDYDTMLQAQDGKCASCGKLPDKRRLNVDHDHITGEIRGLLCTRCNLVAGFLEGEERLMVEQYLLSHRKKEL